MPTTSNFGWTTPADTDLVKDGAAAIRTLGNGIDTSMAQLKGGSTGQVLSKTSNTDMAFTWVTTDDANAIQNAIVDAKGDLITATANDTPARLAVGSNGDTLVADSAATTGLRWQGNYSAGKNVIINGAFNIWQRGTSFTPAASAVTYTADRFLANRNGSGTVTVSQQTFTPGTAPVSGYEGQYFFRFNQSVAGSGATYSNFSTRVEDVRTLAGQTATLSFWAKTDSARSITVGIGQNFGSGGSSGVYPSTTSISLTTSWQRFTITQSIGSVSGKTIGAGSYVDVYWEMPLNATSTIDIWGVQLEAGSVATAFQTATGTLQGELAACQRYYYRLSGDGFYTAFGHGYAYSTTGAAFFIPLPVTMRVKPSSVDYANLGASLETISTTAITSLSLSTQSVSPYVGAINGTVSSGLTQYRPYSLTSNNSTSGYVGFNAEL